MPSTKVGTGYAVLDNREFTASLPLRKRPWCWRVQSQFGIQRCCVQARGVPNDI